MAFDRKAVTGIDLEVDGQSFSVAADEPGKWRIIKPGAYRADADMIADFLDKLESAKAKEFVPAGAPPAQYGLDKPSRVTLWIGKDKDRSSKALLLRQGGPREAGRLRDERRRRRGDAGPRRGVEGRAEDGGRCPRQGRRPVRLRQGQPRRGGERARHS